jgi:ribokinase
MSDSLPVVVLGSLNLDLVTRVTNHPEPGETVLGHDLRLLPGGKGANQALAAARAGAQVRLVGRIGSDPDGARYRAGLAERGVDVSSVAVTPDTPTGRALICVADSGENTIVVVGGANDAVRQSDLPIFDGPVVLVAQFELAMDVVEAAATRVSATGGRVVLNPSPAADVSPQLLGLADPLVVNEHEAAQLAQGSSPFPPHRARALLDRGARSVVMTLGGKGALVVDPSGTTTIPAPVLEAIDTTGAGDVFAGTLAARLAHAVPLVDAARAAVQAASQATRWRGAQDWEL